MARKWGDCDFRQLQRLQNKIEVFQQIDLDKFCEDCAKELAARLLSKVLHQQVKLEELLEEGGLEIKMLTLEHMQNHYL